MNSGAVAVMLYPKIYMLKICEILYVHISNYNLLLFADSFLLNSYFAIWFYMFRNKII